MYRFGVKLKVCRKRMKYTQEYVANAVGVSQAAYSHYEAGDKIPNVFTAIKLAALFEVTVELLFDEAEVAQIND